MKIANLVGFCVVLSAAMLKSRIMAQNSTPLSPLPNLAQSVLLTDAVDSLGARCLDGTPQRYWIQTSNSTANATKWYIHFMGGGWCESLDDCANRAFGYQCYIGSSNPECLGRESSAGDGISGVQFSEVMDFADIPSCLGARWCGGLMVNNPVTNPLTYDWNKVLIPYCDGGSYASANDTVTTVSFNGTSMPLYFRGFRNLQAILADLKSQYALTTASDLIISGDSAGGLATYWHADYISSVLPSTRVVAAPDSGFFYNVSNYPAWPAALNWVVSWGNSTSGLNQACVQHQLSTGANPLACALPEIVSPFIKTPLFVMNSRFDPALDAISGGEEGSNVTNVNAIGSQLYSLVKSTVLAVPTNGAFLTSCHEHCGQWAQGQSGLFPDFNVTIDGVQAVEALSQWWIARGSGDKQFVWVQEASYPCATCCSGGQK